MKIIITKIRSEISQQTHVANKEVQVCRKKSVAQTVSSFFLHNVGILDGRIEEMGGGGETRTVRITSFEDL
jgi:hypothetical protein